MFNNGKDEYTEATEHASINTHRVRKGQSYKLGIFNLFLLTTIGVMGYVGFDSLHEKSINFFNINANSIVKSDIKTDKELLDILGTIDIHSVAIEDKKGLSSLSSAIDSVVNNSHLEDNTFYTQALSREINKNDRRIVVVKKGDTLATLSKKYYGDSISYSKILKANKSLSQTSFTIFVGQELILPY